MKSLSNCVSNKGAATNLLCSSFALNRRSRTYVFLGTRSALAPFSELMYCGLFLTSTGHSTFIGRTFCIQSKGANSPFRLPPERNRKARKGTTRPVEMLRPSDLRDAGHESTVFITSSSFSVIGMRKNFQVQEHTYRNQTNETEDWQHGLMEFENGSVGIFNFSGLSYGSPLRWYNTSKFYAQRGMCVGDGQRSYSGKEQIAILSADTSERLPIVVERRTTKAKDGAETLDALIARTEPDSGLEVVWENPLSKYSFGDGQLSVAAELISIANAHRNDTEPEYGALNGRIDQEVALAMGKSWSNGNVPVELPLPVESR